MPDSKEPAKNKGGRPRKFPGEARTAHTFRLREKNRVRLMQDAEENGRSVSEEIEARIEQSFSDAETIADLRQQLQALDEWDRLLWKTESDRVAARIFAMAIHHCQLLKGSSWREDASVALTIGKATGETLRKFARNHWGRGEGQGILGQLLGPVEDGKIASSVSEDLFGFYKDTMPPLPPLEPQEDPARWSGMARAVVTFKDKATGEVIDKLEGPVLPLSEIKGARIPGLVEFTDKHRANKDGIDVDFAIVHILRDEGSIWDAGEPGV